MQRLQSKQTMFWQDAALTAAVAALLSGIPSTLYAWWTGGDVMEATRAAGAMLIAPSASDTALFISAAVVHSTISLFWAAMLVRLLPRKHIIIESLLAAAAIAVLDLRFVGRLFPEVYALPFWPQFADHLAWGGAFGAALSWNVRRRSNQPAN